MTEGTGSTTSWENPLMPNARLRQIYLAMMQARTLARATRNMRSTAGVEACLVSPAAGLGPGDLLSDGINGRVMEFLRAVPGESGKKKRRMAADCGSAARLATAVGAGERMWTAVGAAGALESLFHRAQISHTGAAVGQMGVVVLYLQPDEFSPGLLQKAMIFARDKTLPLISVVLPPVAAKGSQPGAKRSGSISELVLRAGVPAIPTDADDAVALYRVAEESIGHARIGGGPAVIECVRYVEAGGRAPKGDAIRGLEQYMLERGVVTRAWMDREAKTFARRVAKEISASK